MGDSIYGAEGNILKGKGLFLCAVGLEFLHPNTGDEVVLKIDTPAKFKALLLREKARWKKFKTPSIPK